ncbi:cation efflux protein, CzcI family [Aquabacterium sp. J223]|uniref:cation efflux protein, CzcI family n=1 Tax=Aquabacterium sp. J223 TaxID=2898431 RepID=UPI0021AE1FCC|nr:cation efflux protein, CzcI family [Aquabacterium sp. J223]UUX96647.1 hypothetical protein LRS07_04950 [Aquabacterium sp. J223]
MRRWLILCLLAMLPLQFSWASAAVYCQHETSSEARHFGHHQHEHKAASGTCGTNADGQDPAKGGGLSVDNDCGYCHLSVAKTLQVQSLEVPTLKGPAIQDAAVGPLPTRDPDRHERPNWRRA